MSSMFCTGPNLQSSSSLRSSMHSAVSPWPFSSSSSIDRRRDSATRIGHAMRHTFAGESPDFSRRGLGFRQAGWPLSEGWDPRHRKFQNLGYISGVNECNRLFSTVEGYNVSHCSRYRRGRVRPSHRRFGSVAPSRGSCEIRRGKPSGFIAFLVRRQPEMKKRIAKADKMTPIKGRLRFPCEK